MSEEERKPFILNRSYLLKIDDLVRKHRKSKSSRKFINSIQQDACNSHIASPTKQLIRQRTFRLLTETEIVNIFRKATFRVSFQEIKKWCNQSITDLLKSK